MLSAVLFLENKSLKWEIIYEKAVPDVELTNHLTFDSNNTGSGSLLGFVIFNDKNKQPKNLRQYVQITASNERVDGKQVFYIVDIIKMNVLPPRYFDPVALTITNVANDIITLSDSNSNLYQIDKSTGDVNIFNNTQDVARLVTNNFDFKNFIVDHLK